MGATPKTYNRTAAFVEYCKGSSLEDIAHALAIPLDTLTTWSHADKWALLTPKLPVAILPRAGAEAERAMAKIKANRERNMVTAARLQWDLERVVGQLLDGSLRVERVFANGSRVEQAPGIRDRQDLALYAKHVAELSYRALGDVESTRGIGEGGGSQVGQITIVLPGAVASPREKRAQVIEIEGVSVQQAEAPATSITPGKD